MAIIIYRQSKLLDRLNLYLVAGGLKPASECLEANIENDPALLKVYAYRELKMVPYRTENGEWMEKPLPHLLVAKNERSLEKLIQAKTTKERGLAFGYPKKAVDTYKNLVDDERINHNYFLVCLAKARKNGTEIPMWLAYISFVPEKLGLVNGAVPEESRRLGLKYQSYIRKTYPELASEIEERFARKRLPIAWSKLNDGSYVLEFENASAVQSSGNI